MERIAILRKAIMEAMTQHASLLAGANQPSIEYQVLTDEKHDKYQLLAVGWRIILNSIGSLRSLR